MKCPSAKKRGSIEMQCNLIQVYIIPVLLIIIKLLDEQTKLALSDLSFVCGQHNDSV